MAIYTVSTQSQLEAAVRDVRGGDTILLRAGTYDRLEFDSLRSIHQHVNFSQKVTVASANPDNPAVIRELFLRGASNIEFSELAFDYNGTQRQDLPFIIDRGANITITDSSFVGQRVNGLGAGLGLRVKDSNDVSVEDTSFVDFYNGISAYRVNGMTVAASEFRGMANDGMYFAALRNATIVDNDLRDMRPGDQGHTDLIQIGTGSGLAPSENIVIRGNVMIDAFSTHGIFMGNDLAQRGDLTAYYRNILIEDNYLYTAQTHGVTVDHGNGVTIRNNLIFRNTELRDDHPLINVSNSSMYVKIEGNQVASVPTPKNATWTVVDNLTGTRNMMHWEGSGATVNVNPDAPPPDLDDTIFVYSQSGRYVNDETFRVEGKRVSGDTDYRVDNVDFSRGDRIIFNAFNNGTFRDKSGGNIVENAQNGVYARINSALDLQEIIAFSSAITARTEAQDDLLVLQIEQGGRGFAEIEFEGLGAAFRAAYHPELF